MIEIKKYSNRRLYNTETSAYITLDDIVALIKKEVDFKVVDVDTQSDITSSILTQIILEKENAGVNLIPAHILKQIILFNETKKNNMMFDFLTNSMNAANTNNIFTKGFPNFMDFNFFNPAQGTSAKAPQPKEDKNIDELMTQIDKLKKEVQEIKNQK
ncbi:MAG: polyhydroxyalkanoate synthesis regulator DNA-binding domain-containing protein [Pseudomonadota bacterium]|jgi:polyhydroxyalkanoate synthesis repressor PhaR